MESFIFIYSKFLAKAATLPPTQPVASSSCGSQSNFLLFPNWYEYLNKTIDPNGLCTPQITGISDIWLIVAAVTEILLRTIFYLAVFYIIYGGIVYVTSQGASESVGRAKRIIQNGLIGLIIAGTASVVVNFIASSIK